MHRFSITRAAGTKQAAAGSIAWISLNDDVERTALGDEPVTPTLHDERLRHVNASELQVLPAYPGIVGVLESAAQASRFHGIAITPEDCERLRDALDAKALEGRPPITIEPQSGTIGTDVDPADASSRAPKCAIVHGAETQSSEAYDLNGVVETALARALVLAAEAKRWNVVAQIADELQRRGTAPTRRIVGLNKRCGVSHAEARKASP